MVWMQPIMRFFGFGDRNPVPRNPRQINLWDLLKKPTNDNPVKKIAVLEKTDNGSHWEFVYENGEVYREWYYGRTEQRMMREMDQIGRYIQTFGTKEESPTGPNGEAIGGEPNSEPNTRSGTYFVKYD